MLIEDKTPQFEVCKLKEIPSGGLFSVVKHMMFDPNDVFIKVVPNRFEQKNPKGGMPEILIGVNLKTGETCMPNPEQSVIPIEGKFSFNRKYKISLPEKPKTVSLGEHQCFDDLEQ